MICSDKNRTTWPNTILVGFLSLVFYSCNPFAPNLVEGDPFASLLGDTTTINGFFTSFKAAYELRDISLYETLLDSSFLFVYRDLDTQLDRQWGFDQELRSTGGLFDNATTVRLQWNQIVTEDISNADLEARIVRSFNLTVALLDDEVFRGDGNVNFVMTRPDSSAAWRLERWRDESQF